MALIDVIHSKTFSIIFSMLLGIALASFFKQSCKGKSCVVLKAPNPKDMTSNVYKFSDKCYKFDTDVTKCSDSSNSDPVA